jgi:hypothetical protein
VRTRRKRSALVAALDAGLLQQLAVLLLGHPLATLLDDGTHVLACLCQITVSAEPTRDSNAARRGPQELGAGSTTFSTVIFPAASAGWRQTDPNPVVVPSEADVPTKHTFVVDAVTAMPSMS